MRLSQGKAAVGEDGVQSARVVLYQVEKECNLQMTDLDYDVLSLNPNGTLVMYASVSRRLARRQ